MKWLILPVQSDKKEENGGEIKELEDTRIPSDIIKDYRPFKSTDGIKRTIFYFREGTNKKPLISKVPTEAVDRVLGAAEIMMKDEQLVD